MPEPASAPPRPVRRPLVTEVVSTRRVTPHLIRVVVGGPALEGFPAGAFTDHYVKLHLPPPGASYAAPFDTEDVKARLPREEWPRVRTYTVQEWSPERGELTIDFVHHGDTGVAGPWAAGAQPGDVLQLVGPGGAYTPDPEADWHLMVGDASVVPAITASLRRVPAGVPVLVVLQVDGPEDEVPLESRGALEVVWLHAPAREHEALADALRARTFPAGRVHAFVHGEASGVRAVRRHLLAERELPRDALSVSGYWKDTRTEEGWREDKAEWNRLVEQDA